MLDILWVAEEIINITIVERENLKYVPISKLTLRRALLLSTVEDPKLNAARSANAAARRVLSFSFIEGKFSPKVIM